jgi:small-conductance mechanosensitive channel
MQLQSILNTIFLGNTFFAYLQAFDIFLAVWIVLFLLHKIVLKKLSEISIKTSNKLDDLGALILAKLNWPIFVILGLNASTAAISINILILRLFWIVSVVTISIYLVNIIKTAVDFWIQNLKSKNDVILDSQQKSLFYLVSLITQILVWTTTTILILQFLQIDVTALVGTLGIGGIAIAFALQSILSDIFASFSIYLDQPFGVGDFIQLGTDSGTVEKIGVKSTRIKTLQGEMLIVPNKELTGVRIQNFSHLEKRRAKLKFNVVYDTSNEHLKLISKTLKDIISAQDHCVFERANFETFGSFGLTFEAIYSIETANYKTFMDIQEEINLALKAFLENQKIQLAIPNNVSFFEGR